MSQEQTPDHTPQDAEQAPNSAEAASPSPAANEAEDPQSAYAGNFDSRSDLSGLKEGIENIRQQVGRFIVGQELMVDLLLTALLSDGHVLLEGVPGVAKTLTAKLLARCLQVPYSRIQFTPDLMPSDVLGTSIYNMQTSAFEFKAGPLFSSLVLIDEINRSPAKTQAALFEVMEERQVTIDGQRHLMEEPFIVLATQNPIEQEGTYRLPEAQLDRFLIKIAVGYPSQEEEFTILKEYHERGSVNNLDEVEAVLNAQQIKEYRQVVAKLHIDQKLMQYIAEIVNTTRVHDRLFLGASPRASIALMRSAKAYAALHGRDFVTPDDIKTLAGYVIGHRVLLTPEAEMEGQTAMQIVNEIVNKVEVPR